MSPSEDARRILEALRGFIAMRGHRLRDLEGRIHLSAGTLRRILNGSIELKFRHITGLLAVLDIPTKTFFKIVFDSKNPEQAQLHLAQAALLSQFEPPRVMSDPQQIEAIVLATMKRLGFDREEEEEEDLDDDTEATPDDRAPTPAEPPGPKTGRRKPDTKKDEDPNSKS